MPQSSWVAASHPTERLSGGTAVAREWPAGDKLVQIEVRRESTLRGGRHLPLAFLTEHLCHGSVRHQAKWPALADHRAAPAACIRRDETQHLFIVGDCPAPWQHGFCFFSRSDCKNLLNMLEL